VEDVHARLGTYVKQAEQALMAAKSEALRPFDLTVAQYDRAIITHLTLSYALVDPVIEDHTVHQYLDDSCTLVLSTLKHTLPEELHIDIERTSEEATTCTEAKLCWDEWILYCTIRRALRDKATGRSRGVLSFC